MCHALHMTNTAKQHKVTTDAVGPWVPEWSLADRLRKARQSFALPQREFAAKLGVTASAYQQWEGGFTRPRNVVAMAKRIEMLTGVSATWILGLETAEPRPVTPAGAIARPEGFEPPTFWLGVQDRTEAVNETTIATVIPIKRECRVASDAAQPDKTA